MSEIEEIHEIIAEQLERLGPCWMAVHKAAEKIATRSQSERVSRLEEALKPFADAADEIERDYGTGLPDQQYQFPPVTMADFRRARSALNQGADDGRD